MDRSLVLSYVILKYCLFYPSFKICWLKVVHSILHDLKFFTYILKSFRFSYPWLIWHNLTILFHSLCHSSKNCFCCWYSPLISALLFSLLEFTFFVLLFRHLAYEFLVLLFSLMYDFMATNFSLRMTLTIAFSCLKFFTELF